MNCSSVQEKVSHFRPTSFCSKWRINPVYSLPHADCIADAAKQLRKRLIVQFRQEKNNNGHEQRKIFHQKKKQRKIFHQKTNKGRSKIDPSEVTEAE
jgi:hypothetical protein